MHTTNRRRAAAALPLALAAAGAGLLVTSAPASAETAQHREHRIQEALDIARNQKGDPYAYGADGPRRFDCSGLIYFETHRAGFTHVPRTASAQAGHMNRIPKKNLRTGDFVFFYDGAATARDVYHVGVFTGWHDGHRTIVHAPRSGERVKRERIWTGHWFAGTLRGLG
ncbi:MAG: C40 family peptidase [Nocardioides sp.]